VRPEVASLLPFTQNRLDALNRWDHAASYGGKPWRYVLIPHDEIAENITLDGLAARFSG